MKNIISPNSKLSIKSIRTKLKAITAFSKTKKAIDLDENEFKFGDTINKLVKDFYELNSEVEEKDFLSKFSGMELSKIKKMLETYISRFPVENLEFSSMFPIQKYPKFEETYSIDFSSNGKYIATGSMESIALWDVLSREKILNLNDSNSQCQCLCFDEESKFLYCAMSTIVHIYQIPNGKQINQIHEHCKIIRCIAVNQKFLATGGEDRLIVIWDLENNAVKCKFSKHNDNVRSLDFNKENPNYLVSAGNDKKLILWDLSINAAIRTFPDHSGWIGTCVFSNDGNLIASSGKDLKILIWNVKTGENTQDLEGHSVGVLCVTFSNDDKKLASSAQDGTVKLWNVDTGELIHSLKQHKDAVYSIAFHPFSNCILASCSIDDMICLWDLIDKTPQVEGIPGFNFHKSLIFCIAFNEEKGLLASGGADSKIFLWDTVKGVKVKELNGHVGIVYGLVFSKNGEFIYSAGEDGTVKVWDLENNYENVETFNDHLSKVYSISLSPSETLIASAGRDKNIVVRNLMDNEIFNLKGHSDLVISVDFDKSENILASGSCDQNIIIWDLKKGNIITKLIGHQDEINRVLFSPNSEILISCSNDGKIFIWDFIEKKILKQFQAHSQIATCLAFSQTGEYFASGSYDKKVNFWDINGEKKGEIDTNLNVGDISFGIDNKIYLVLEQKIEEWDLSDYTYIQEFPRLEGHKETISSLVLTPDGKQLISGSLDSNIFIWCLETNEKMWSFQGNHNGINALCISPDGNTLYSAGNDQKIIFWNLSNRKKVNQLKKHNDSVLSLAINPSGTILVSGGKDQKIFIWNLEKDGVLLKEIEKQLFEVNALSISSDGAFLASAGNGKVIILWNLETFRKIKDFDQNDDRVNAVKFSPNCKILASAGTDFKIVLWNISNGEKLKELTGHDDNINCLLFIDDGNIIISGSSDRRIFVWNVLSGERIIEFKKMKRKIWDIALVNEGKQLASASSSTQIFLWNLFEWENHANVFKAHDKKIFHVSYSPNGKYFASCGENKLVKVWEEDQLIQTLRGHLNCVNMVLFTPDSKEIASCGDDRLIIFWEILTGVEKFRFEGHLQNICSLSFYFDQKNNNIQLLASGTKNIRIWDVKERKHIKSLKGGHREDIRTMKFFNKGENIISGSYDMKVLIWCLDTARPIKEIIKCENLVQAIALNPSENLLAIGGNNRLILMYSFLTDSIKYGLNSHERAVLCLDFSSNGEILASGSADKSVILWNVENGEKLHTLKFHKNSVDSICFSPDNSKLITAGWDSNIAIFTDLCKNFHVHMFYNVLNNFDDKKTFNFLLKNLSNEHANRLIFYYKLFPFNLPILNLICYLQNEKALQGFFAIVKKNNCKLTFTDDIFGNNPMTLALESPDLTKLLINFLFDNSNSVLTSSLISEDILCKLIEIDYPQITKLIDSRLTYPPKYPTIAQKIPANTVKTCVFQNAYPSIKEIYEEKLLFKPNEKSQKSKVEVQYIDIPHLLNVKSKFLSAVAQLENTNDIFSSDVLQYVVTHKWRAYAFKSFLSDAINYFIFVLLFTFNATYIFCHRITEISQGESCLFLLSRIPLYSIIGDFTLICFLIMYFLDEFEQVKIFYQKNNFENYISSPWNWIDWLMIIFGFITNTSSILHTFCIIDFLNGLRVLQGISLFFVWMNMLGFLRGIEGMSAMIRMMLTVLSDTRFFLFLLFYFAFAFTFASKFK